MHAWPIDDAKARFGEFLDQCLAEGPQMVTRRGVESAVLVAASEWRQLQSQAGRTLKDLLLCEEPRGELVLRPRGQARPRPPIELD